MLRPNTNQPAMPTTPTPPVPIVNSGDKKWMLWGLISFTVILLITAVILFVQLNKPISTLPQPTQTQEPQVVPVKQAAIEGPCELSFSVEPLACTDIIVTPSSTSVTSDEERDLEAVVTGGSGTYTHSWTTTSNGTDLGSLDTAVSNPTTWTAPSDLGDPQTWTVMDTITDTSVIPQTVDCEVEFEFTGLITCFDVCEINSDCEPQWSCMDVSGVNRCVEPSCPENSDCLCASPSPSPVSSPSPSPEVSPSPSPEAPDISPSPIVRVEQPELPEAGVAAPAVLGVSAGVLLMILGLLF